MVVLLNNTVSDALRIQIYRGQLRELLDEAVSWEA
jgi:hypothetical protein